MVEPRLLLPALFTLALSLGALGCGEEAPSDPPSRCSQLSCEEGLECDEADGLCKCGGAQGVVCPEGTSCRLQPSPSCVSETCTLVGCDRGQSCDPKSGSCVCGSVVCAEDEVCVAGSCEAVDLCRAVVCAGGLVCDPLDGDCKCGGERCEEGMRCVDGGCELDPCAGVSCGINSVCDPADGRCRCGGIGGMVCNTGESCLESEDGDQEPFRCAISTRCDDSDCPRGTVCDPEDGACRCGGIGAEHPVCGETESCIEGSCRGSLLCEPGGVPIECAPGLDCDPLDGRCKCGGIRGSICGPDEVCTELGSVQRCLPTCTLLEQPSSCPEGEGCYFDPLQRHGSPFCAERGSGLLGDTCDAPNGCAPSFHCSLAGLCTQLCDARDDPAFCGTVGLHHRCAPFSFGDPFGYCVPP